MVGIRAATAALVGGLLAVGCGGGDGAGGDGVDTAAAATGAVAGAGADSTPLTQEELERGIGPVREVELGAIDEALAERGEEVFELKCFACHRLEERYVAPQLGNVLERRRPEYVMNMILNPAEMLARHPVAKELLAEYMTMMPDQDITEAEARAILEYIRAEAREGGGDSNQGTGSEAGSGTTDGGR